MLCCAVHCMAQAPCTVIKCPCTPAHHRAHMHTQQETEESPHLKMPETDHVGLDLATDTCVHPRTHPRTTCHVHACTHTHTHTHTHPHTRAHTRPHTQARASTKYIYIYIYIYIYPRHARAHAHACMTALPDHHRWSSHPSTATQTNDSIF